MFICDIQAGPHYAKVRVLDGSLSYAKKVARAEALELAAKYDQRKASYFISHNCWPCAVASKVRIKRQ